MPMLFVNGTNDFAYPLDSYQKSYRAGKDPRTLCVTVRMPHGHTPGWTPKEIGLFVDSILDKGKALARIGKLSRQGQEISAAYESEIPIKTAALHYTTGTGPWREREWKSLAAKVDGKQVRAALPTRADSTCFLTLSDECDATVSSGHQTVSVP